jgi:hypothetical protein
VEQPNEREDQRPPPPRLPSPYLKRSLVTMGAPRKPVMWAPQIRPKDFRDKSGLNERVGNLA